MLFDPSMVNNPKMNRANTPDLPPPPLPNTGWKAPLGYFPSLEGAKWICIDCETKDPELATKGPGVRRPGCHIVGVAVNSDISKPVYYPLRHEGGGNMDYEKVFKYLAEQLARPIPKIGANILYDVDFLEAEYLISGIVIKVCPPFFDVISVEGLIDENRLKRDLGTLGVDYCGEGKDESVMTEWQKLAWPKEKPKSTIWKTPPQLVGPYAESDVTLPPLIFEQQLKKLREQHLMETFSFEYKLLPLLLKMRQRGVPVDLDAADRAQAQMRQREQDVIAEIKRKTGVEVEPWVKESLAKVFDQRGISYPRTPKSDQPSITKGLLEKVAKTDEIAAMILEVRTLDKLRGTFIDGYIFNSHVNGRIHCQFHSLKRDEGGTDTGRLSSSNPNLQNIPSRDKIYGPMIRSLFVPDAGLSWWSRDYDQVEYRLIVEMAFRMGFKKADYVVDLYRVDPTTDFHQSLADLTGLDRTSAKNLNFGLAYGQGLAALCAILGVGIEEGKVILDGYHDAAPFIKELMDHYSDCVVQKGHVTTISGRRRRFIWWEDKEGNLTLDENEGVRRSKPYAGLNSAIQGSAADVMKKAMVDSYEQGIYDAIGVPYLTVHDELDGGVDLGVPEQVEALKELSNIMRDAFPTAVPLTAGGGEGPNWAKAK